MTNTAETIEKLRKFRLNVNNKISNREILSFNIGSINIAGEKMFVGDDELSNDALKKVLSHLRVKNNFLELGKKMVPSDWETVKEKLKSSMYNQTVYARKVDDCGVKKIDDIYMAAPKTTGILEIDAIFNEVIESIVSTGKDISLKESLFLEDKDEIVVTLLEHGNEIDVFGNGTDLWKIGKQIVWNGVKFSIAPFFERLVCSNGNTAMQYGYKSNISNNKFNLDKIQKILEKEIVLEGENVSNYIVDSVSHLKYLNISVNEFLKYKNFFNEKDHYTILTKWLDDSYLNKIYGVVVDEMPTQWKMTADSGKNAYDFFNDLTYIASHKEPEITLTERERLDIQIKASDLLFKKEFDLENIAPKIDWTKVKASNPLYKI